MSSVGGEVEARGDPEACARLSTALSIDPDPELARAHVHGFHSYPARMHPVVARRLVELFSAPGARLLDPFCGSGTVLVEARLAGREAIGLDLNPLAVALASLKATGATPAQAAQMLELARSIEAHGQQRRKARAGATRRYPEMDTRQFEPHVLLELDSIRDGLEQARPGSATDALWLVLSSMLTKVSRRQGDTGQVQQQPRRLAAGFTLRLFVRKAEELGQRLTQYLSMVPRGAPRARVICGDARQLPGVKGPLELIVSSPPYPGTYDYLAHHETRLRWLGLEAEGLASGEIGARRALEAMGGSRAVARFERELAQVLQACARLLSPGASVLLLVADSVVAGQAVRMDELVVRSAVRAALGWVATASQRRPHFHRATAGAFGREARREHVVLFRSKVL